MAPDESLCTGRRPAFGVGSHPFPGFPSLEPHVLSLEDSDLSPEAWDTTEDGLFPLRATKWAVESPQHGVSCCGSLAPIHNDIYPYVDTVCIMHNVRYLGEDRDPGWDTPLNQDKTDSFPGPIVRHHFQAHSQSTTPSTTPHSPPPPPPPILLGWWGGIIWWSPRVFATVSLSPTPYPPTTNPSSPEHRTECTRHDSERTLVVFSDAYEGNFFHDKHNHYIRAFGTLAGLEDGLIECNLKWDVGCRVQRDKIHFTVPGQCHDSTADVLAPLSDRNHTCAPEKDTCYDRVIYGLSNPINFYRPQATPRAFVLLHHLVRHWYYLETGRALPQLFATQSGRTHAVHEPHIVVVVRNVARGSNRRAWDPAHLKGMMRIMDERGLSHEVVSFDSPAESKVALKAFRRATMVLAVSGAGLTNLVFIQPGTVVVRIFPFNSFGYDLVRFGLFTCITNLLGGVMVDYQDLDSDPNVIIMPEPRFHALLDTALSLGIHASLQSTFSFKFSNATSLNLNIILPDPTFVTQVTKSPGLHQWPPP